MRLTRSTTGHPPPRWLKDLVVKRVHGQREGLEVVEECGVLLQHRVEERRELVERDRLQAVQGVGICAASSRRARGQFQGLRDVPMHARGLGGQVTCKRRCHG